MWAGLQHLIGTYQSNAFSSQHLTNGRSSFPPTQTNRFLGRTLKQAVTEIQNIQTLDSPFLSVFGIIPYNDAGKSCFTRILLRVKSNRPTNVRTLDERFI